MARRTIPEADLDRARQLLADGASMREASRETGISLDAMKARGMTSQHMAAGAPPPADPAPAAAPPKTRTDPAPRSRRRARPLEPSDDQLVSMLTKVAVAPAVPMAAWVHCTYCAGHFAEQGPKAAVALVELSEDQPELRKILVWMHSEWAKAAWAGLLVAWLGVPLMHHLAPVGIYRWVAPVLNMPAREAPSHQHAPSSSPSPAMPWQAADNGGAGNPFAGLDMDQLLATARSMGIELPDLGSIFPVDAAVSEPAEPADAPEGAETETADSASADPDAI